MKTADKLWLVTLGVLAVVAWLRNTRWWGEAADVLPILVALPLGAWLGKPWTFTETPFRLHQTTLGIGVLLTVVGGFLSITLLLAAGWTCLLWAWLRERTANSDHWRLRRILVFAFLAFPWVTLDLEPVGWWFRLSGAYVTAGLFKAIGFHVIHNGTELTIQGAPIAVTAACSGLKVLQSMLIAGSFLAHVLLGDTPRYWQNIAALAAIAWAANTARILLISVASLTFGQEFAMGLFHTWGGLSVLVLMFIACWGLFQWQAPRQSPA